MKALIIIAHGSRRQEANNEIVNLTNSVEKIAGNEYGLVAHAFLELAKPTLLQSIENVINQGATDITIMPYFLNSGNHVTRDIPKILETAQKKYPDCTLRMAAYIGMIEEMPELILSQSKQNHVIAPF